MSSIPMERADLVISSTRVVTPQGVVPAAVAITGGVITSVRAHGDAPNAARYLDVGTLAVLPGVVDTHVHVNEPGRTEWEGFETATRAAAAGGVTTWPTPSASSASSSRQGSTSFSRWPSSIFDRR